MSNRMTNMWSAGFLLWLQLAACGPKDVIPAGPDHPASPGAPSGATGAGTSVAEDEQAIAAAEQAAYERARPVFERYCAKCHSSKGEKASPKKLGHLNIDGYPFGGHHAGEIGAAIREVLGVTGEEATMPMDAPGAVKGEELEAIVEWSKAFDRAHAAGLHQHGEHGDHGGH